jgi:hypothetical protein
LSSERKEACSRFEESLAVARGARDEIAEATAYAGLARCALMAGDLDLAREHARACEQIHRARGDEPALDPPLHILAYAHYIAGDDERARAGFEETLELNRRSGNRRAVARELTNLGNLAGVASARGEHERAARLLGAGEAMLDAAGMVLNPGTAIEYEWHVDRTRTALRKVEYERAVRAGRELDRDAAIEFALRT